MVKVLLIAIVLLALAFAGIGIKMLLKKGGQFEKHCGSVDPATGKRVACSCGATDSGDQCHNNPPETAQ